MKTEILNIIIEAGIISTLFYAFYILLKKYDSNFSIHRIFLLVTYPVMIVFPIYQFQWNDQVINTYYGSLKSISIQYVENQELFNINWLDYFILAISLVSLAHLFNFFRNLIRIYQLFKTSGNSTNHPGKVKIIRSSNYNYSFSFFKTIFIGTQSLDNQEEIEKIIEHEKVHVKMWHSLDTVVCGFFKSLFWFNPMMYLIEKELKKIHEFQADLEVSKFTDKQDYISLISRQFINSQSLTLANNFAKCDILTRINQLNSKHMNSPILKTLILPFIFSLFIIFSCDSSTGEIVEVKPPQSEKIYSSEEANMPKYKGGMQELANYVQSELKYPKSAYRDKKEGKTLISFVIDKEGKVIMAEVVEGFDSECDKEALRVISNMPDWNPGTKDNKNVNVKLALPIVFKI